MSNPKGIIVGQTFNSIVGNPDENGTKPFTVTLSSKISSNILKKYLLYWDLISYPTVNGFGPHLDRYPELGYLHSQGILQTENVIVKPSDIDSEYKENHSFPIQDLLAYGQIKVAKNYLSKNEVWSIAQVGEKLSFSSQSVKDKNLFELSLLDGLPVPSDMVSFDDIINFRISHTRELDNFRRVLEKFRNKIIDSSESERTLIFLKEELSDSISRINECMKQHKIDFFSDTLSVYLNVPSNHIAATAFGVLLASNDEVPILLSGSIGAGVSVMIKAIGRSVKGAENIPKEINDFMYLYSAQENGIISRIR